MRCKLRRPGCAVTTVSSWKGVKQRGSALEYSPKELRQDREPVLEEEKPNGGALQFASEELRSNHEFVLEAVKRNGTALEYAPEELSQDREPVLEAGKQNGGAMQVESEEQRSTTGSFWRRTWSSGWTSSGRSVSGWPKRRPARSM